MNDSTDPVTLADKLRAAADLIDAHPGLPDPVVFAYSSRKVDVTWQLMNSDEAKDDQRGAMQRIVRAIDGKWTKHPYGDRYDLEQTRGGLCLQIVAHRDQVCERVVTGTETVTVPAVEAQPEQPERTEVIEVVEWRCSPLLGDQPATEHEAVSA